jgi:hypothetical protein
METWIIGIVKIGISLSDLSEKTRERSLLGRYHPFFLFESLIFRNRIYHGLKESPKFSLSINSQPAITKFGAILFYPKPQFGAILFYPKPQFGTILFYPKPHFWIILFQLV